MPLFTTADLALKLDARLEGASDLSIEALSDLEGASLKSLTFVGSQKYAAKWVNSKAVAVIVSEGIRLPMRDGTAKLWVKNADLAMAKALEIFAPSPPAAPLGIHVHASVDASASFGKNISVGPHAVVGPRVTIGDNTILYAGAVVMDDVKIGKNCIIFPNVVIYAHCEIGDNTVLNAGAVIGADGFGYRGSPTGIVKIPHIGKVIVGNHVEIGANTCVDRAKFDATVIGDFTKLDNLIHIGHNCIIGRYVLMGAGVAVGGSTLIGDGAQIGGHAVISDHLRVGVGVRLVGNSTLMNHVPDNEDWAGTPAVPKKEHFRMAVALRRLPDIMKLVKRQAEEAAR